MNKILHEPIDTRRLAKIFNVSTQSVNAALAGRTGGERAHKIRSCAIAMGCRERGESNRPAPADTGASRTHQQAVSSPNINL